MDEIVKVVEGTTELGSSHIKATPYAIEFEGSPSIEEWYNAVQAVQKVHGMCQFYLGDLVVYAESPVTGWGESKYTELIDKTGYDVGTLMNFASIARRFSSDFRKNIMENTSLRNEVSFGHFNIVKSLDDKPAQYFLEMCRDGGWSVAKLREEVYKYKHDGMLPDTTEKHVVELPDGWLAFNEAPKDIKGYVPAPRSLDNPYEPRYLIEFTEYELEKLKEDYEDDPTMTSLIYRINMALGSE